MKRSATVLAIATLLAGCVTSTATYTPPKTPSVANSKTINEPFELVWDRLVKGLSSDFFVINNLDKSSRLINISFSASDPQKYVDCGTTVRTFKNARGESKFTYAPGSTHAFTTSVGDEVHNVQRQGRLEGRSNIYLTNEASGATTITANSKYVVKVTGTVSRLYPPATMPIPPFDYDFSTKEAFVGSGPDAVSCAANGTIEARILRLVDPT